MAIAESIIDQVQARVDIVEVISSYLPLKKMGRSYKALCPFHHEKTPSFVVSQEKQIYHCFGCGAGGNVFSFLMKHDNLEFPEAVEMLAEKAGVALPSSYLQKTHTSSEANQLYKVNELACQFFQVCLANNNKAREYLASRGVGEEALNKFKIGYAPDAWEGTLNFFKKKDLPQGTLEKSGLIIANDRGGYYDRFRNRIIFPIMDLKDHCLGFGARVLDSSLPKYLNSPETYVYSKGKNLYGLNISRDGIKKEGHALLVEGYLDMIIPYQAGITNMIATLGTALTVDQIKLIKRFTNTAVIVYDPDAAGEAASIRNLDLFISEDVNVYIAELPGGLDPDSFIRKFGADEFRSLIKASKNLFDYKLDKVASRFDMTSIHGKARIAQEMLPTIARINNAVLKSGLVKKLSERLGVDEEALREELKKSKPDYAARRHVAAPAEIKKSSASAEKMLLAIMLEGGDYIVRIRERLSVDEFTSSSVREAVSAIFSLHEAGEKVDPSRIINIIGNASEAALLISEAVTTSEMLTDKDRALVDCIARMKKDNIKDQLKRLQEAISMAHNAKEQDEVKRLVAEYDSLVKSGAVR